MSKVQIYDETCEYRPPRNDNGMRLKLGRNLVHKAIASKK